MVLNSAAVACRNKRVFRRGRNVQMMIRVGVSSATLSQHDYNYDNTGTRESASQHPQFPYLLTQSGSGLSHSVSLCEVVRGRLGEGEEKNERGRKGMMWLQPELPLTPGVPWR